MKLAVPCRSNELRTVCRDLEKTDAFGDQSPPNKRRPFQIAFDHRTGESRVIPGCSCSAFSGLLRGMPRDIARLNVRHALGNCGRQRRYRIWPQVARRSGYGRELRETVAVGRRPIWVVHEHGGMEKYPPKRSTIIRGEGAGRFRRRAGRHDVGGHQQGAPHKGMGGGESKES